MKKLIALLLATVLVAGLLTSCSKKSEKADTNTTNINTQFGSKEDNRPYAAPLEVDGLTTSYVKGNLFYRYGAAYDPATRTLTRYHNTVYSSTLIKTETKYDQKGYAVRTTTHYSNNTSDKYEYEYDLNTGHKIRTTSYDTDGNFRRETKYEYDIAGNKICQTNYDADGKLTEKTTYEYDVQGNLIRETEYDATDKLTKETRYKYDTAGNKIRTGYYDAEGTLTGEIKYDYKYDAAGNKIQETYYDENRKAREYEYDADGNHIRETYYTDNEEISYETRYNAKGKEIYYIKYDENRNPTKERIREYDEHDNLIRFAEYKDGKLDTEQIYEHQYDAAGNLIIRTQFNSAGELTHEETYEYGTNGKLAKCIRYRVSANEKTVLENWLYTYDEEGNLICEILRNAKGEETQTFEYEPAQTIVWGP